MILDISGRKWKDTTVENKDRAYWLDVVKVVCTMMIVGQHSISYAWTNGSIGSLEWDITALIFMITRGAVMVFFICSGCGMLSREKSIGDIWKRNIWGLLKIYCCWMLVYGVYDTWQMIVGGEYSLRLIINVFLKKELFGHYHTWFIWTLVALYAITPLMKGIVQDKKHCQYFLVLSAVFSFLTPVLYNYPALDRLTTVISDMNMNFVVGFIFLYVLGHYLITYPMDKKINVAIIILGILISTGVWIFSLKLSLETGTPQMGMYDFMSPFGVVVAVTEFLLLQRLACRATVDSRLARLGKYGFGIYLMHPLFVGMLSNFSGLYTLVFAVIIYLVCLLTCVLLGRNKYTSRAFIR